MDNCQRIALLRISRFHFRYVHQNYWWREVSSIITYGCVFDFHLRTQLNAASKKIESINSSSNNKYLDFRFSMANRFPIFCIHTLNVLMLQLLVTCVDEKASLMPDLK